MKTKAQRFTFASSLSRQPRRRWRWRGFVVSRATGQEMTGVEVAILAAFALAIAALIAALRL